MLNEKEKRFLNELYVRYYESLLLYSYALLDRRPENRALAEDCIQQTFVKGMLKMKALQKHKEPYLWLKKTCRYITLSERRKLYNRARILKYPIPLESVHTVTDTKNDIADWIAREDLLAKKQQLLGSLTQQERHVYSSVYEENKSIKESAHILGISEASVRGALQRIRNKVIAITDNFENNQ